MKKLIITLLLLTFVFNFVTWAEPKTESLQQAKDHLLYLQNQLIEINNRIARLKKQGPFKDKKARKGRLDAFIASHNRNFIMSSRIKGEDQSGNKAELFPGKELTVTIESIGSKGDGIAKYKSYIVIVPNTKVNDKVNVVVKNVRMNLVFTELSEK